MFLSILVTTFGVLLICFTIFDVFVTVLHPQEESPLSSRLQTTLWSIMRILARGFRGRARHRFLGLAVPLMVAALVATWIGVLLLAFGLIYAAWIGTPGAFRVPAELGKPDWADALYFSGATLGTTGYGDLQPIDPLLRIAAVIEGFSGVAVLSLSIAYVLEVYPVFQRQQVLAVLLNEETAGRVQGLSMLERYLRNGNFEALAGLLRTINLELLFLAEAHRRLSLLHYNHPTETERSFLRILLIIRNLVGALRYGLAGGDGRAWSEDPRVQDLEDSLFYTLHALGSSKHLPLTPKEDSDQRAQDIEQTFHELIGHLKSLHLPTPGTQAIPGAASSEFSRACTLYVRFYLATDTALRSYVRNSGYKYADAIQNAVRPQMLIVELEAEASRSENE
jgi:hypothetical protein